MIKEKCIFYIIFQNYSLHFMFKYEYIIFLIFHLEDYSD